MFEHSLLGCVIQVEAFCTTPFLLLLNIRSREQKDSWSHWTLFEKRFIWTNHIITVSFVSLLLAVTACEVHWCLLDRAGTALQYFFLPWGVIERLPRVLWEDALSTSFQMPFSVSCSMKWSVSLACVYHRPCSSSHNTRACMFAQFECCWHTTGSGGTCSMLLQMCPCVQTTSKNKKRIWQGQ